MGQLKNISIELRDINQQIFIDNAKSEYEYVNEGGILVVIPYVTLREYIEGEDQCAKSRYYTRNL